MGADALSDRLLERVRDLKDARRAWCERDAEKSKMVHSCHPVGVALSSHHATEIHMSAGGDVVRAVVFGGLDGIVTMFALLSGCIGAEISLRNMLVIGVGNLLADAFAMGFGEYISSMAEHEYIKSEWEREEWELENYPEGERREMLNLYVEKYKFAEQDAELYVKLGMRYPEYFLQHMMFEELGISFGDATTQNACVRRGCIMFISFICHGLLPLVGYVVMRRLLEWRGQPAVEIPAFLATCVVTLLTLALLGASKARLSGQQPLQSALAMASVGAAASAVAFSAAHLLRET